MSQVSHVFYNVILSNGSTEWSPESPELVEGGTLCICQHISTSLPSYLSKISPAAQMVEGVVHRLAQGRRIAVGLKSSKCQTCC